MLAVVPGHARRVSSDANKFAFASALGLNRNDFHIFRSISQARVVSYRSNDG